MTGLKERIANHNDLDESVLLGVAARLGRFQARPGVALRRARGECSEPLGARLGRLQARAG
eukprot:2463517-Alexandrium_andersonii.AAC.1